jgi:hypothetical protein
VADFEELVDRCPDVATDDRLRPPERGAYDIGTKPRSRAAYRRFIVPLSR